MLLKITESCHMGCSHCMSSCVPCDRHMTEKTFRDVLEFVKTHEPGCLLTDNIISGGEPSEHPEFLKFVEIYFDIIGNDSRLYITTNGQWILENPEKAHELLDKYPNLKYQVTYEKEYYPKKLDITKRILRHKRIEFADTIQIYPMGRARLNNLKISEGHISTKCFNLILLANQRNSFQEIINALRSAQKTCIPAINYDGTFSFGESDLCPRCCSIYDSDEVIYDKLKNFTCNDCPAELWNKGIDSLAFAKPSLYLKFKEMRKKYE